MDARHRRIVDDDVVVRRAADGQTLTVEHQCPPLPAVPPVEIRTHASDPLAAMITW